MMANRPRPMSRRPDRSFKGQIKILRPVDIMTISWRAYRKAHSRRAMRTSHPPPSVRPENYRTMPTQRRRRRRRLPASVVARRPLPPSLPVVALLLLLLLLHRVALVSSASCSVVLGDDYQYCEYNSSNEYRAEITLYLRVDDAETSSYDATVTFRWSDAEDDIAYATGETNAGKERTRGLRGGIDTGGIP